ncbi:HPP family protein [Methylobacterium oryzae CBMB20]
MPASPWLSPGPSSAATRSPPSWASWPPISSRTRLWRSASACRWPSRRCRSRARFHPPGGAAALTALIGGPAVTSAGFLFPLFPVCVNSVILVALGIAFHKISRRNYPHVPVAAPANTHGTADPPPRSGSGSGRRMSMRRCSSCTRPWTSTGTISTSSCGRSRHTHSCGRRVRSPATRSCRATW